MKDIHARAFDNLRLLVELDLSWNLLTVVPLDSLKDRKLLRKLSMRGNPLKMLDRSTLRISSSTKWSHIYNKSKQRIEEKEESNRDNSLTTTTVSKINSSYNGMTSGQQRAEVKGDDGMRLSMVSSTSDNDDAHNDAITSRQLVSSNVISPSSSSSSSNRQLIADDSAITSMATPDVNYSLDNSFDNNDITETSQLSASLHPAESNKNTNRKSDLGLLYVNHYSAQASSTLSQTISSSSSSLDDNNNEQINLTEQRQYQQLEQTDNQLQLKLQLMALSIALDNQLLRPMRWVSVANDGKNKSATSDNKLLISNSVDNNSNSNSNNNNDDNNSNYNYYVSNDNNNNNNYQYRWSIGHYLGELQELDLGQCQLNYIQPEVFYQLKQLKRLLLDGNRLQYISARLILNLPDNMHQLALEDNLWYCDCRLYPIKSWLDSTKIPLGVGPRCHMPNNSSSSTTTTTNNNNNNNNNGIIERNNHQKQQQQLLHLKDWSQLRSQQLACRPVPVMPAMIVADSGTLTTSTQDIDLLNGKMFTENEKMTLAEEDKILVSSDTIMAAMLSPNGTSNLQANGRYTTAINGAIEVAKEGKF